jgi:hypothetical protein
VIDQRGTEVLSSPYLRSKMSTDNTPLKFTLYGSNNPSTSSAHLIDDAGTKCLDQKNSREEINSLT